MLFYQTQDHSQFLWAQVPESLGWTCTLKVWPAKVIKVSKDMPSRGLMRQGHSGQLKVIGSCLSFWWWLFVIQTHFSKAFWLHAKKILYMYVFIFFITKLMNYTYVLQMLFVYWLTVILFTLANNWWTFLIALFSLLVARQLFLYWLVHIPSVSHHWSKMLVILFCNSLLIEVMWWFGWIYKQVDTSRIYTYKSLWLTLILSSVYTDNWVADCLRVWQKEKKKSFFLFYPLEVV